MTTPVKKLRILVTGGAGFVGSHLCERLVHAGHHVIAMDNFFTSQPSNVAHLRQYPNFELIRHDIRDKVHVFCDQIYNLACPAAPGHYQFDPIMTFETAVYGTHNMLELARRNNARILQASTSEIYGDALVHPQKEDYRGNVNPIGPRACYDEGKRAGETLMFDYLRMFNVDVRVIRIFNTYGPRMHPYDGRVISNFVRQALNNEDITVYGDGSQTRSFQYVDDLVEGMIRMMNNDLGFHGPVNIGNPGEYTIKELAEKVIKHTGTNSKLIFKPLPVDDPVQRRPVIELAQEKLGWEPKVPLDDGLEKTIAYFKSIDLADFTPPTKNY